MRSMVVQKELASGKVECPSAERAETTTEMYSRSSSSCSSKQAENVWNSELGVTFLAWQTMAEESIPPLKLNPTGTSLRRRNFTESSNSVRNCSTSAASPDSSSACDCSSQYFLISGTRGSLSLRMSECAPGNWKMPVKKVSSE